MKRRLEVLVGVLFASALMLGGCVAQTDDADDPTEEAVGQGQAALVSAPTTTGDPARSSSGGDSGGSGSLAKSGVPGMADPQPQPWKPPPSPGGGPADPEPNQH